MPLTVIISRHGKANFNIKSHTYIVYYLWRFNNVDGK